MARRRIIIFIFASAIILLGGFFIWLKKSQTQSVPIGTVEMTPALTPDQDGPALENQDAQQSAENSDNTASNNQPQYKPKSLPSKVLIGVPFTPQAPFAVWDEYHEEACEEASLIMLKYYLDKKSLTPQIAEDQIQKMIAFEIKNYGDYKDSDAAQIVKLADDFYDIKKLRVIYDFQKDDLKKYLAQGNPIIVPAAGRMLGNPNFTQPGPLYHNLVLKGYDGDTIITNDPGTRKGEGYKYDIGTLYKAIHDFPGDVDKIAQGRKAMIVLE